MCLKIPLLLERLIRLYFLRIGGALHAKNTPLHVPSDTVTYEVKWLTLVYPVVLYVHTDWQEPLAPISDKIDEFHVTENGDFILFLKFPKAIKIAS